MITPGFGSHQKWKFHSHTLPAEGRKSQEVWNSAVHKILQIDVNLQTLFQVKKRRGKHKEGRQKEGKKDLRKMALFSI